VKNILLGDNNTRYVRMIDNGNHRKKRIFYLDHEDTKIQGQANLKSCITNFYKGLFGEPEESLMTLDEEGVADINKVTELENAF
jgi:hypothetical protein